MRSSSRKGRRYIKMKTALQKFEEAEKKECCINCAKLIVKKL